MSFESGESLDMVGFRPTWGWGSETSSTNSTDPGQRELARDLGDELIDTPSHKPDVQRIQEVAQGLRERLVAAKGDLSAAQQHIRYVEEVSARADEEFNSLQQHVTDFQVSNIQLSLALDNTKFMYARRIRVYNMVVIWMLCLVLLIVSY